MLTNYKIRKIVKKEKFPVSKTYEHKMDSIIRQIEEDEKVCYTNWKKNKVLVGMCALLICVVLSVPVKAAVDYVQERMIQMTDTEKEEIYEEVQNSAGEEAIVYSRDFTEQEEERYDDLLKQYEDFGKVPSSELEKINGISDKEVESLLYDAKNRILYLPERELSDEELLEIIDYYHKADYALQESSQTKEYKAEQKSNEDVQPLSGEMAEEKAIEKGKKFIHSAFQINTDDTIISVEYIPGDNDYVENAYGVDFGTSQGEHYVVTMNAATENLQDITFYENEEMDVVNSYYQQSASFDRNVVREKYEIAKQKFMEIFGSDMKFVKTTCEYQITEDNTLPTGNVQYFFILENGDAYGFRYNLAKDAFWNIYYLPEYEQFESAQAAQNNVKYQEKKGVKRCVEVLEDEK